MCYINSMKKDKEKEPGQIITTNREAWHNYFIQDTYEAGIVLEGCEVKSLRDKQVSLAGSFARFEKGALWLYKVHIAPYLMGNRENPDPLRDRKLLLHKSQLSKLKAKMDEKGLAIIPLRMYFNERGIAKVEIAVAQGKKFHDKRADIKKATAGREIDRAIKSKNRN